MGKSIFDRTLDTGHIKDELKPWTVLLNWRENNEIESDSSDGIAIRWECGGRGGSFVLLGNLSRPDEFAAVTDVSISREFKFDEQANTAAITNGFGDWKNLKDVEFADGEITGRSLSLWGKSRSKESSSA